MAHKKRERFSVHIGARGRLVLPARVRKQLSLTEGDELLVSLESDGSLRLVSPREQTRRARGMFRDLAPGRSLASELIADRRREAAKE